MGEKFQFLSFWYTNNICTCILFLIGWSEFCIGIGNLSFLLQTKSDFFYHCFMCVLWSVTGTVLNFNFGPRLCEVNNRNILHFINIIALWMLLVFITFWKYEFKKKLVKLFWYCFYYHCTENRINWNVLNIYPNKQPYGVEVNLTDVVCYCRLHLLIVTCDRLQW